MKHPEKFNLFFAKSKALDEDDIDIEAWYKNKCNMVLKKAHNICSIDFGTSTVIGILETRGIVKVEKIFNMDFKWSSCKVAKRLDRDMPLFVMFSMMYGRRHMHDFHKHDIGGDDLDTTIANASKTLNDRGFKTRKTQFTVNDDLTFADAIVGILNADDNHFVTIKFTDKRTFFLCRTNEHERATVQISDLVG
jgi:hypothetical protein